MEKAPCTDQSLSLRDLEQNLSDLKKENFSLKLRIYYMEEKNQDPDLDLHRENVELKVQLQGLIRELQEKDEQLQGLITELQEKDEQLQGLITELQEKDEKLQGLSTGLQEKYEQLQEKDEQLQGLITELQEKDEQLQEKDEQLQGLRTGLQEKYVELGRTLPLVKISANQSTKENKQQDAVTNQLQEGLESRLLQEEVAKEEVTEEEMTEEVTEEFLQQLLQAQTQVQTLQNKIRISEDRNRLLLKRLGEMEVEVRTVRQEAQVSLYCREPEDRVLKEPSLLQQKTILDQELYEVKTEAQKTGKALLDLRAQNQEPRQEVMSQHQETFDHRRGGAVLDMGYETCDRSETEAERDISSPEFDDLEMCLSLDHSADLWRSQNQGSDQDQVQVKDQDKDQDLSHRSAHGQVLELQLLVKHLQSELNQSKVQDPELTDLLDRVETLENQIKSEARTENQDESRTGHLVHLQARELSHLRQVLRESRSLVQILLQSLTEQLQGVADLQASGGEHGRTEQLQEIHQLTQRLYKKISLKQLPEEPEDKSELLAMRLSKELQQKDRLIQSLRSELQQDDPTDSDQSECSSYMSEELSSNQDTDLYSDLRKDQSQSSSQSEGSKRTEFGSMFSAAPPSAQSFPMMHRSGHAPCSGHAPSGVSSLGFSLDSALRPGLPHPSAFWETVSSLSGSCPMPSHNDLLLETQRLREAFLLVQTQLKEAELKSHQWAELCRRSQSEVCAQRQEVIRLQEEVREHKEIQRHLQATHRPQGSLRPDQRPESEGLEPDLALPTEEKRQNEQVGVLLEQLKRLRQRLWDQEQVLNKSQKSKEELEQIVLNQLWRTRDVLRKAKTNLQGRQ